MSLVLQLGPRLRAIAARVLEGRVVADLCCDHARLAAALVAEGRVPRAIAGDINAAPLQAAAAALDAAGITEVELRRGDGLAVLGPDEAIGTAVLAGIGAPLTELLLERGRAQLERVERLILQPNHGFPKLGSLRAKLAELGWRITDEAIARERGRLYMTIVAEPDPNPPPLDPRARELGPIASLGHDPLWPAWVEHERERVERALAGLARSAGRPEDRALAARYRAFVALLDDTAVSARNC